MALARNALKFSKLSKLSNITEISGSIQNSYLILSVRTKHWNPKWKWLRQKKVIPMHLPNYESHKSRYEQMESRLKELGIEPPRYWRARPMTISSSSQIFSNYTPPKDDGKLSLLSKGAKELATTLKQKQKSSSAIRKIKSYDASFDAKLFPQQAHDIYVKAHTVLMNQDQEELSEFVTEKAISEMLGGLKYRTLRWKFIESLEPPILVNAAVENILKEGNLFAQVIVRFHTKQSLAIYDRFGRLYYGSEIIAKDVLEYVVFEKHIVNYYGTWKLHGKIIPENVPASSSVAKTYRVEEIKDEDDLDDFEEDQALEEIADRKIVKPSTPEAIQEN